MPSRTRKRKIPALSAMAEMSPVLTTVSSVATGWKFVVNSAPTTTPMNSELYASFVTRARTIAISGGTSDHAVSARVAPFAQRIPATTTRMSIAAITTIDTNGLDFFWFMVSAPTKKCVMIPS